MGDIYGEIGVTKRSDAQNVSMSVAPAGSAGLYTQDGKQYITFVGASGVYDQEDNVTRYATTLTVTVTQTGFSGAVYTVAITHTESGSEEEPEEPGEDIVDPVTTG